MSRNRSGRLSFALTLFAISVLVAVIWGYEIYDYAKCIAGHTCEHYQGNQEHGREPEWWYVARWLVVGEDTIAQWLMMAFTMIAAGLLWFTLGATRHNNTITREIGEAQARAYLSVDRLADFELGNLGKVLVRPKLKNSGSSPAFNVAVDVSVVDGDGNKFRIELPKGPPPTRSIQAGGEVNFRQFLFTPSVTDWHNFVRVFTTVTWDDIFEKPHEFHQVFWLATGERNIGEMLSFGEGEHP